MTDKYLRELIEQSNLIEGIDDPAEIDQSLVAWNDLITRKVLGHAAICKTQKVITLHQHNLMPHQRGYYRSMSQVNVIVGGYVAPSHTMVELLMGNWVLDYASLTPWEAHVRFEKIHPFVDGNGRTGRMLMWWHELSLGQEPTLIKASERQAYYAKLKEGR